MRLIALACQNLIECELMPRLSVAKVVINANWDCWANISKLTTFLNKMIG